MISQNNILFYNDKHFILTMNTYSINHRIYLGLLEITEEGYIEPYCNLTVNIDELCPENYAFLDINNVPWADKFINEFDLGSPTGIDGCSGFCRYPLFVINTNRVKELAVNNPDELINTKGLMYRLSEAKTKAKNSGLNKDGVKKTREVER